MAFQKFSFSWLDLARLMSIAIACFLTTIFGGALRGNLTLFYTLVCKQLSHTTVITTLGTPHEHGPDFLESIGLKDVRWYILVNICSSTAIYFTLGGFLHWYYYVRQRDKPEKWKCQPKKFLSNDDAMQEFILGYVNLLLGSSIFGVISSHISSEGYSTVYYDPLEKGALYLLLSAPGVLLYNDFCFYHYHRMLHKKFFFKRFHKVHHHWKAPTFFSATAMHPLEFLGYETIIISPIFLLPINAAVYLGFHLYVFYFGMIGHSGIAMESIFPWQPSSYFHDNHHKYNNCNYGFNSMILDRLYGTLRMNERNHGNKMTNQNIQHQEKTENMSK